MANIRVYDPVTRNSKIISLIVKSEIIQQDGDGQLDYFLTLKTSAKKINGDSIREHSIRTMGDLLRGDTQQDGVTITDYLSITDAVQDHVLNMVEGTGGTDAMDFNS